MKQLGRKGLLVLLEIGILALAALSAGQALGRPAFQTDLEAQTVWEVQLPDELHGRLYELAIVPDEARVVATSPEAIWGVDGRGEFQTLVRLEAAGEGGESATLSPGGGRAGILTHQHHAILGFRLIDLRGETLAEVKEPLQFHYRIAPDGRSFVGIDAAGQHVQSKADKYIYRFYDESGKQLAEVVSERPQPRDSAYTPDGGAFVLNNAAGLAAYRIDDGRLLWQAPVDARLFAAGALDSGIAVAAGSERRDVVQAYRGGNPLWQYTLEGNVRNLATSPGGEFILATDQDTAHLLSVRSDQPLWSFSLPDRDLTLNSAAVNDRGVVALGAQQTELDGGLALILDPEGNVIFEREVVHKLSNAWIPGVQFDQTGSFVLIKTLEELVLVTTE